MSKKNGKKTGTKSNLRYAIVVFVATFFSSSFLSLNVQLSVEGMTNPFFPILLLILVVSFGVVADLVGVSVTVANPAPFNAKAARKTRGAKKALFLVRNADRMANIFNDVIGDICGIVSGGLGSAIVFAMSSGGNSLLMSVIVSGIISAFTVGGKSIGKTIAMNNADSIVWTVARILSLPELLFVKNRKKD